MLKSQQRSLNLEYAFVDGSRTTCKRPNVTVQTATSIHQLRMNLLGINGREPRTVSACGRFCCITRFEDVRSMQIDSR